MMSPREPASESRLATMVAATFYAAGAVVGIACGLAEVYVYMLQALFHVAVARDAGCPKGNSNIRSSGLHGCESQPQEQLMGADAVSTPCCARALPVEAARMGGSPAPPATPNHPTLPWTSPSAAPTTAVATPGCPAAEASWTSDALNDGVNGEGGRGEEAAPAAQAAQPSPPAEVVELNAEDVALPELLAAALPSPPCPTPTASAVIDSSSYTAVRLEVEAPTVVSEQVHVEDLVPPPADSPIATFPDGDEACSESGDNGVAAVPYATPSSMDPVPGSAMPRRLKASGAAAAAAPPGGLSYEKRLEEKRQHGRRKGAHKATTR